MERTNGLENMLLNTGTDWETSKLPLPYVAASTSIVKLAEYMSVAFTFIYCSQGSSAKYLEI